MKPSKTRRLESTVAFVQQRYSVQALRRGSDFPKAGLPPHVITGFPQLDLLTGCAGVPLGAITLLSGRTTSGKLTLAYKVLSNAQAQGRHAVALFDLGHSSDPDYIFRCGVDLDHLLVVRPQSGKQAVDVILDLARSRQVRALLVDSLADLLAERATVDYFDAALPQLNRLLPNVRCALICLDEPHPPWHRWFNAHSAIGHYAALHVELQRERWLEQEGELRGYQAQAQLKKSRWARSGQSTSLEIIFNGTVRARRTW